VKINKENMGIAVLGALLYVIVYRRNILQLIRLYTHLEIVTCCN